MASLKPAAIFRRSKSPERWTWRELGHLVYSGGKTSLLDDSDPQKKVDSETNTREILKHCQGQIDKIKN